MITLDKRWKDTSGRPAGFDYMRILLALAVLTWHSYQVSYGQKVAEQVWDKSWFRYPLLVILPMFFALSGFLVSGSMARNPKLSTFLTLRAIRIFPALVVETILSALLLGPILTAFPLEHYFADPKFVLYLANCVGWVHYELPGVFLTNPVVGIVNASLWTVPYELECYILISLVFLAGGFRSRRRLIPIFLIACAIIAVWLKLERMQAVAVTGAGGRYLVLCFLAGVVINGYRNWLPWHLGLGILALVLSAVLLSLPHGPSFIALPLIAYATACLGMANPPRTVVVSSGDYSYGTYLYAGPIQQTVTWVLGTEVTWARNWLLAAPITIAFALFSWWCIEKPFLRVRKLLINN